MTARLPLLLFGIAAAVWGYALWIGGEHAGARQNWERALVRAAPTELRETVVESGSYAQPLRRIVRLDFAIGDSGGSLEQWLLISRDMPARARPESWATVVFPIGYLFVAGALWAGAGYWFAVAARRRSDSTGWRLGQLPPAVPGGTKFHRQPASVCKANLFWASLGLLGVGPNFLVSTYPWMWAVSGAFSALYMTLLILLALHNRGYRTWTGRDGIWAASALGCQFVPFAAIRRIVEHTWRDRKKRTGEGFGAGNRSVGDVISRRYHLKDRQGKLLMSIPRELQPPVTPLVERLVKVTGVKIELASTTTTSNVE